MKWTGVNDLREKYQSFFESKGHIRLASAPLVPKEDKSLLLINSGMAPLKNYFLGVENPPRKRVTTCQKCIRTPDIEEVGKTKRHGTFFEMLGNFSFGDYFKEEAIAWAWEFFTKELEISSEKIWVSVYQEDDEAYAIWTEQVGFPKERMVRLGKEDNFWEIGAGPCGPSSELYFDRGEEYGCDAPVCGIGHCDCDRYMEIWNLVFTQFNSDGEGNYTPLQHPNIDTGMGLERLACVVQGVDNLFEIDTITRITEAIAKKAGVTYGKNEQTDTSLRVVTDHIRSTVFMVGDGVLPQNEGRGYVLRRLLRRAARHGRLLGILEPFLHEITDVVLQENRTAYPALTENADYIKKIISAEEERFAQTIEQGMDMLSGLFDRLAAERTKGEGAVVSGDDAFRLYDTYGFPIDLTREIAADRSIRVDEEGFRHLMEEQRARARKAHAEKDGTSWEEDPLAGIELEDRFVGYDTLKAEAKILAVVAKAKLVEEIREGEEATVVMEQTPFYAESGGQVGDTGILAIGKNVFKVTNTTLSHKGNHLHHGQVLSGFVATGDTATALVDKRRRHAIMRNHTGTHLLQAALRNVLGNHVHQSGSLVDAKTLRFDFTHFSAMTIEQLKQVEKEVNDFILESTRVTVTTMSLEEAKKQGATALFGDKYADEVRVCSVEDTSRELCGGTHVRNTAEVGLFKIISESSVASGVRRIEAVTGQGVLNFIEEQEYLLMTTARMIKANNGKEIIARAEGLMTQISDQQREIRQLERMLAEGKTASLDDEMQAVGSLKLVVLAVDSPMEPLAQRADQLKNKHPELVGVFIASHEGKNAILAFAGNEAIAKGAHAGKLIKEVSALGGGSGGGRADHAMGGMTDSGKIEEALAAVKGFLQQQLGE